MSPPFDSKDGIQSRRNHLMMRHVCLFVLVVGLLMVLSSPAEAQISPGALSQPHSSMDGLLGCTNCHTFGTGRAQLKCMTCHVEIQKRVSEKRGYHGLIVNAAIGSNDCTRCHTEHGGRDFALIRWTEPQAKFDHKSQAGFALEGKHAELKCASCHAPKNISAARKTEILVKDLNKTFLGLGTNCASCHTDVHQNQLGANCATCHSQTTWKQPPGFNHDTTKFRLTGLHTKVTCIGCHAAPPAGGIAADVSFKKAAFADCVDCHKDPHRGSFNGGCKQCHSTSNWKTISLSNTSFDHSKTKYPLTGLHARVACEACHKTSNFSVDIPSAKCTDCHTDKHKGQFLTRLDKGDCQSCHTVNGFKPSTFTVAMHKSTPYPLTGKHEAVACVKCHTDKGVATDFHPKSTDCLSCHHDMHRGQFTSAPYANRCESCHTVDGFKPSTFGVSSHAMTKYPLTGKHVSVACGSCHADKGEATDFHPGSADCLSCHRDMHQGQFASAPYANRCESCHNVDGFHPSTFTLTRHKETRFPLVEAHAATPCADCHKLMANTITAGTPKIMAAATPARSDQTVPDDHQYRFANTTCVTCHRDIHGPLTDTSMTCESCHTLRQWKALRPFDHNKTKFKLEGSHKTASCVECHKPDSTPDLFRRISFRNAPQKCADCHEDIHAGQFKQRTDNCTTCHGTTRWKPSTFDHETARFSLAGAHVAVRCQACHVSRKEISGRMVLLYADTKRDCAACH